ncbi:hypothetical protein IWX46DRAFT_597838 [Phyllosticta citricarpa]|uniref:Carrier domain-containing protein n=1 Tax=Phyllosticta citricarpa TaxID=55181 RepID=A0ABR1MHZ5_9PEZI
MQLTSFPNLCSSDSSCDPPYAAGEIVLHGLDQLSDEAIIAGWGLLLGAYAGVDDVSFLLDDSLVQVGATGCISTTSGRPPSAFSHHVSGLFFKAACCATFCSVSRPPLTCIQEPPPLHVPLALTLHCDRSLGRARLAYSSRIPACHAQQMAAQLKRCILAASGSDQTSQAPVSLSVLNPEPKVLDGPRLLHHLIRRDRYHDQLAIDFIDRHGTHQMLSYSALDRLTTVLAQKIHLSLPPTKKQHVVPLLIPQSPELYIAQISILKAGAAFCPLNLDAPPERVKFIINDVSAHLVITTSSIRHKIPQDFPGCVLSLNQQTLEFALDDAADLPSPLPEQLAYVMYTSGSTGTPKGVGVSHLAATQSLLAHDLHIPEFSRFLQFAAPIFDVSVFETFFPFFRGRTLCTCERTDLLSDLPLMMNKLEVDAAELTPTVAGTLLQSRHVVPQLRLLLTIGEMLSPQVVQEFGGNDDKTSILWGMYGPTEAAIHCTLQPSFHSNSKVGNIGRPLDTVSAFILAPSAGPSTDFSLDVVPLGQVGELAVGGHQLARGYLNRPEQTAAAFVQHPKYGRLYRTGDKARLLPDGTLECLGRIMSGQIKLRGQRVELGEVEQAISNISGCRNATASVISGVLVVFVLLSDNILTPETVISESKRWLPAFMVPGDVILLDKLPRLPSGKVDRQTLETNYQNRQTRYEDRQTHIDATEHKICQLVSRVLAQPVLPTSNLTSLGLDSLKAIRVASLLRSSGFKIGAVDFLAADDVASLSSMVQSTYPSTPPAVHEDFFAQVKHATLELPEFVPYLPQVEDVFPCTPVQSAMLAEAAINSEAYCNWVEIEIRQPCNAAEIRRWLHILAEKNQILRTGFANLGHSLSSHSQIVWNGLLESQISEVCDFERGFALSPPSWALRPLQFQVLLSDSGVKVLCRMFHALYDGWSIDLVVNDLNELAAGRPPKDRPQFRDVVVHHTSLTEAQLGRSLDYWRNQLDNYAYSALPNFNGRVVPASSLHVKSRELTTRFDDLRRCAAALKVNPQVMFQAALAYLLSFYLNNTDVTFGTVTSGRTIPVPGIEEILGPCIATLPLRLDVARSHKIKNLLLLVHERNRAMLKHCEIPTRDIKKMCGLAPGSPLYDVLFVWQETLQNNAAPDAIVRQVDGVDKLEFKLTLELEPRSSSVCAKATYDPSILPSPQVDLILGQLEEITSFFIANVEGELTESSKHLSDSLLSMDNVDFDHFEFQAGPPYCVETRAEKTPNALAVEFSHAISESGMKTDRITYRELNTRANQLAHALLALGTTPEDLVCINMEKSIDLYVSILATLKVGAGYVPIIPETPFERVRFILKEAKVKTILAHSSTSAPLVPLERNLINVDQLRFEDHSSKNPNVPYDGSRVGYAVFTSGSTGTPKGVLVTQDNLMSNLEVLARMYPVDDGSRLLQQCSQAFDVSVFEIFFAWYTGMCLCSGTKDELFHDVELAIRQMRVTHLSMTPTVAALVRPENVPDVKFLVTSGEAVTEHVRRIWAGRGLWQGYGPSETTNICTVNPRVSENDLISNIGPAFANTSAFVMDEAKDVLVPKGGVGELCFGGDQVFRGYLNQPELTAKKVINHPKFGRIYRSGDLGRLCPDGSILFTGRSDDQVKLRGQRIELGEINSRILDCPEVKDCVTLLLGKHGKTVQQLASFWVPSYASSKEFGSIAIDEPISKTVCAVFGSLESSVPAYMLPNALIPVSALPRTTQGKTDRRKLTALYEQLTSEYLEAVSRKVEQIDDSNNWSDLEHTVAVVLADVAKLSRQEIGRQVSFFAYGVDSISAISFSTSLKARGLPRVPVSTILKNPTVARLSKVIEATSPVSNIEGAALDLDQVFSSETREQIFAGFARSGVAVSRLLPCSPLQEAMLSSGGLAETTAYLNKMLFKINGDADLMRQCWFDIVKRHDILRTCFVPTEDSQHAFAQVVLRQYEVPWDIIEDEERLIGVQVEHYTEKILPLMDPSKRPPVRFATFNTGDSVHLLFCCHHAIYDGFAMELLVTEVEQVYSGAVLPPAPSFDPYLEQMIIAPSEEADAFWAAHLRAFEPTSFPDLTGLSPSVRKDIVSRKIFAENLPFSCSELEDDCRRLSCSLLALGQAAFAKVISVYTGENDLCFGNVVSGRTLPIDGLERLVAPCFNTLPIRVNFDTVKTNNDLLASLQSFNADILPYQLTPLRRIQANNTQDGSRLFDTLFILQQSAYQLNGDIWELKEDFGEMDFSLVCELVPNRKKDALALILRYDEAFIPKSDIFCVAKTFASAFKSCLHDPSALSSDVGVPNELLSLSNLEFETLETSAGPFLHSGLEINAACRPDAVALEFQHSDGNRGMWTFNELNQISNQIAHALLMHEVSLEDAVPICITKSPSYYASVLAVLKAGAAFTPIDDSLPASRKDFMLKELGAKVLIASRPVDTSWVTETKIIFFEDLRELPTNNPLIPGLKPNHLAYRLYTSGSTGTPKAVSVEHRNPVQTVEASRSIIPWTNETRLLQFAAITFDMCYYDCFLAWTFGFTLCAAEQPAMLNDIVDTILSLEITLVDLTPSVAMSIKPDAIPSLQYMYCIGEAMPQELVDRWEGKLVNSYGPTEAAFCVSIFKVSKGVKSAVIGKPFPTTSFSVRSRDGLSTVPLLGVGELYLGGPQVAREYHANPEKTKASFVIDDGRRFYQTGDLVRMLGNGTFEFVGRVDDQVKIRGLRVELSEISHVVEQAHPALMGVHTQVIRASEQSKEQLVAFLAVGKEPEAQNEHDLILKVRDMAKTKLPAYMVPKFFVPVDKIPLSAAGKVDRKALKTTFHEWQVANQNSVQEDEREWTVDELEVRAVFAKLSNAPVSSISLQTTIYQLGLDSISAVQVAAILRKKGFKATAVDVLERPTCEDLGSVLQLGQTNGDISEPKFNFEAFDEMHCSSICQELNIPGDQVISVKPCTPLQSGMVSKFLQSKGRMYFNYMEYYLPGVDAATLEQAWHVLLKKHEILRSGFVHINDSHHPFGMLIWHFTAADLPVTKFETSEHQRVVDWRKESLCQVLDTLHKGAFRVLLADRSDGVSMHLSMLHSLYDAQSLRTLLDDLANIIAGADPSLSPVEPGLSAILGLSADDSNQRKQFWEQKSKDIFVNPFPKMTPLKVREGETKVLSRISAQKLSLLESGCRHAGVSMQAAGQSAWARLLCAYTGEEAATFGVVFSGRTQDDTKAVAFPCITTVPLPARNHATNRAVLDDMMAFNSAVRKHQFTPLTKIQRWTGHPDEVLFDTIFAYQKLDDANAVSRKWRLVNEEATVDVAISIELEPNNLDQLELRIWFNTDRLPLEQAQSLLEQLDTILVDLINRPDADMDAAFERVPHLLSITPPKEREIQTDVELLHEFVEKSARRIPDKIAFEFATNIEDGKVTSKCWTYSQLDAEGNQIANLLISRGVQPGGLVGVCFDKCPEASIGILGILKAGCAFVALDPGAPVARKAFITEDSNAQLVLSMSHQSNDFKEQVKVPLINLDVEDYSKYTTERPQLSRNITPQDLSYCLYTSGTTGTPKGCELTHENAVQAMMAFSRLFYPRWDTNSRWLQFASFHFDVSVLEQYWSWAEGIRLTSAPRDLIFEDLAGAINALQITHIDLTPSLAKILSPEDVPSLTRGVFITGGEALKQEILDAWGKHEVIHNGYGPTEATIGVTMFPRVPENGKPSNIGPQFDNVGSFVFKPKTNVPVIRGGVGELCVSGKLVGKGYLHRPQLTDERFPYLPEFDERVYRTGDLVRILHDGSFDFLGRADDQVKLRGQRLEIGEINSVINQNEAQVLDSATLVLKHPKQQKDQLISFVVTKSTYRKKQKPTVVFSAKEDMQCAQDACRSKLPTYMVPTYFIPLTSMPLSPNNKADGKQLKEIYSTLSAEQLQAISISSEDGGAASSAEEKKIFQVLTTMASVSSDNISRSSSIFELGLDSISVIGFANALRKAGFENAQASSIMKNSVISRLAKVLSSTRVNNSEQSAILAAKQAISACQHQYKPFAASSLSIDQADIEDIAPCSPLQQGIISRVLESEKPVYFASFKFELATDTDLAKLKASWQTVYESVQILRARFVPTDDGYIQAVLRDTSLPWVESESEFSSEERLESFLSQRKHKWWSQNRDKIRRPFELVAAAAPAKTLLSINIMHTLYDGVSLPILLQIVQAVYYGKEAIDFGPRFLDVLPYGPLRSIPESQDFWKSHLAGAQSPLMPSLISKPQDDDVAVKLRLDDISAFETVRRRLDVTHQALAQASWAAVLQKHFAGSVTFGMIVSGRSIDFEGAERTIGPLFNTIPFHMRIGPDDNWVNVVRKCHDFNTSCMPHQHTPLRDIVKWAKRPTNQPLFDTLFVFQHEMETAEPCAELWKLLDDQPEADYPLALEVEHKIDGSLGLTIVAQGHVMDEESARGLLKEFENALRDLLRNEGALVSATVDVIESSGSQNQNVPGENGVNGSTNGVDGFEWTPVARKIQEQVATLAGMDVQEVDEQATIFEFGLDSIDAIKLSSRLKKMDVNLPVSHIMRSLTIPKMAREVQDVATDSSDMTSGITLATEEEKLRNYFLSSNRLDMEKVDRILPVTPLQEAMVTEMVSSGFRHYFNHDVLKLDPEVDLEKMNQAWNSVYRKSTILRTAFEEIDDPDFDISFAQIVYKPRNLTFQEVDIVDEKDIGHVLENIRERTAQNDGREGLLQLTIVSSLSAKYLILSVAHALYDGWSLGLLHNDVQSAYEGKSILRPSYDRILESILNASGKRAARFWRDFLEGALSSAIPHVARVQGQISDLKVHRLERKCSISINKLRVFCKKTGITLQALGQTAWSLVLAAYLGKLDLVFGVVLSGRDTQEAEDVMFPTMNTVAVRSIVHGTRKDMLRYMQENIGNIRQFQHFPLRKAKAMTNTHGKPLFDSLFMFQARPDEDGVSDSGALYKSIGGASDVEYPVAVEMEAIGDALVWRTACKSDVFDSAGTEELLKRVDAVIQGILNAPDEAAVVFGEEGVCVCGLPPFKHAPTDNGSKQDEPHTNGVHNPNEWSSLEQTICKVLSMVSKIPENEITRDATIFHLGLDSISAIKVSALLRKTSIKISVSEMLRAGTVANMAKAIETTQPSAILLAAPAAKIFAEYFKGLDVEKLLTKASILSGDVEQVMSASAGQVYMLSVWQQTEGQTLYPGFRYRISGVVHKDVLRDAWIATVAANPILRTAFLATGDQELPFIQVILNSPEDSFHLVDESASIKARSEQPFVALFAQKQGECWILTIKIHHALYDGVSLPVIVQQFETHCNKAAPNPNSPTVFPSILAHGVARDTIAKRKSFWTSYLASSAPERLPQPQSTNSGRTSVFRTNIAPSLLTIERIAPKHGLNIQTLFLAAYARIYARLTNFASTSDVIIGIWLANRALSIDGLVDAAIPTVNLVPLRVPAPLKTPLFDTAKRIQADLADIGTAENSSVALSEIHHWTGIQADTFVNFLKLPEGEDSSTVAGATEGGAGQDNSIRVHEFELPDHPAEGWSHVEKYEGSEWQDVPELANNAVKNSYLVSVAFSP